MKAVTVYRSNTRMSWGEIRGKVESITKRGAEVLQIAADRAIFWVQKEQEIEGLLAKLNQLSTYKTTVTMGRWRKEDHWQNLQISARYSWIGIEGILLTMWNFQVFEAIREACGGLLEIAKETVNKTYLGFAKIKVKGFHSGLMNPIVEIMCEGEKVCLGAFAIIGPKWGVRGYRSAGNTTRTIMKMRSYGSNDGDLKRPENGSRYAADSYTRGTMVVCEREEGWADVDERGNKVGAEKKHEVHTISAGSDKRYGSKATKVTDSICSVRSYPRGGADCSLGEKAILAQSSRSDVSPLSVKQTSGPVSPYQMKTRTLQISRDISAIDRSSFKEALIMGLDQDKISPCNKQILGLGQTQFKKGVIWCPKKKD